MSYRDQWKMIHLLNTCSKGELTTQELDSMSVSCVPDTIHELLDSGIVQSVDRNDGPHSLHPIARKLINNFIVCRGDRDKDIMYVDQPMCFVIMPFSESWSNQVYEEIIKPAIREAGLECVRGDEIERTGQLTANIFKTLQSTGLVIAEISSPNPNVYYELGVADTLGKEAFILYQEGSQNKIAADKQGVHYHAYDRLKPEESKQKLRDALKEWVNKEQILNTPLYCKMSS